MKTILTIAFVILLATDVQAMCFKPVDAKRELGDKWHEHVTNIGVSHGELVKLYRNIETGSWTLTITREGRVECVLSAGERWRDSAEQDDPA